MWNSYTQTWSETHRSRLVPVACQSGYLRRDGLICRRGLPFWVQILGTSSKERIMTNKAISSSKPFHIAEQVWLPIFAATNSKKACTLQKLSVNLVTLWVCATYKKSTDGAADHFLEWAADNNILLRQSDRAESVTDFIAYPIYCRFYGSSSDYWQR